jgi:small subunit ribosomal protein S13
MARLLGVDIPMQKPILYSLTSIYGIGVPRAKEICALAKIDPAKRTNQCDENELAAIRSIIMEKGYVVEGDLRRNVAMNIKNEIEIGSYRGMRHRKSLPVRGQRTKTNGRTRKGPRKTVANKKVETKG